MIDDVAQDVGNFPQFPVSAVPDQFPSRTVIDPRGDHESFGFGFLLGDHD
jgi:hypothetical protein